MLVLREVCIQREVPVQLCHQTTRTLQIAVSIEKIPHSENAFGFQLLRELHRSEFIHSAVRVQETRLDARCGSEVGDVKFRIQVRWKQAGGCGNCAWQTPLVL